MIRCSFIVPGAYTRLLPSANFARRGLQADFDGAKSRLEAAESQRTTAVASGEAQPSSAAIDRECALLLRRCGSPAAPQPLCSLLRPALRFCSSYLRGFPLEMGTCQPENTLSQAACCVRGMGRARAAAVTAAAAAAATAAAAADRLDPSLTLRRVDMRGTVDCASDLLAVEALVGVLRGAAAAAMAAGGAPVAAAAAAPAASLLQLAGILRRDAPHINAYFCAVGGHAAVILHLKPPTAAAAAAALRAADSHLPPSAAAALASLAVAAATSPELASLAAQLLEAAASKPGTRLTALAPPSLPQAGIPSCASALRQLTDAALAPSILARMHHDCASALIGLMARFGSDAASRAATVSAGATPLAALMAIYNTAEKLPGCAAEGTERLPATLEACRSQLDAEAWLAAARLKAFNPKAVALRKAALAALRPFAADAAALRAEAFERRSGQSGGKAAQLVGTALLPGMLRLLRELAQRAPRRTAPLLGWDGKPKAYTRRRFAADFDDNPVGDAMVAAAGAAGDDDGAAGPSSDGAKARLGASPTPIAMPAQEKAEQPQQELTLIELSLEALAAAVRSTPANAAAVLVRAGAIEELEALWDFVGSAGVTRRAERLAAQMAEASPEAAEALRGSDSAQSVACLLRCGSRPLLRRAACERLLQLLPTASGDEFAAITASGGPLEYSHALLCRMDATAVIVAPATASGGAGGAAAPRDEAILAASNAGFDGDDDPELRRALQALFMRCLERARSAQGHAAAPGRPPLGGCWSAIGLEEILRQEERITGVKRPGGHDTAAQKSRAAAAAAAVKNAASVVAAAAASDRCGRPGSAPAPTSSAVACGALQAGSGAGGGGGGARGRRLPWDPAPKPAAGGGLGRGGAGTEIGVGPAPAAARAPAASVGRETAAGVGKRAPLMKKGFLPRPGRPGEAAEAAAARRRVAEAAAAAAARTAGVLDDWTTSADVEVCFDEAGAAAARWVVVLRFRAQSCSSLRSRRRP